MMARQMQFIPELRHFLRDYGEIYTVRKYDMTAAEVEVEEVGLCRRIPLGRIYGIQQLGPYLHLSGFYTLEAWWTKIGQFIPQMDSMFLYHVVRLGDCVLVS
jgi:hypothetical protein